MNYEVVGERKDVTEVVRQFLASKRLNRRESGDRPPSGKMPRPGI